MASGPHLLEARWPEDCLLGTPARVFITATCRGLGQGRVSYSGRPEQARPPQKGRCRLHRPQHENSCRHCPRPGTRAQSRPIMPTVGIQKDIFCLAHLTSFKVNSIHTRECRRAARRKALRPHATAGRVLETQSEGGSKSRARHAGSEVDTHLGLLGSLCVCPGDLPRGGRRDAVTCRLVLVCGDLVVIACVFPVSFVWLRPSTRNVSGCGLPTASGSQL